MANEPTPEMRKLVTDSEKAIDDLLRQYQDGEINDSQFEDEMQIILARGHMTSYMIGQDMPELGDDDFLSLSDIVQYQTLFLANFVYEMRASSEFIDGWYSRAEMYASAFNTTYWSGRFKMLPLPAMPGQGTQCLSNCRCGWDVITIDAENGDYDAFWVLDPFVADEDHCQTCKQRESDWNPVRIRDGILQL